MEAQRATKKGEKKINKQLKIADCEPYSNSPSGFTAKLAGTERGITEPTPTFSACFGQAFLELHPTKYAEELVKRMEKSGANQCYKYILFHLVYSFKFPNLSIVDLVKIKKSKKVLGTYGVKS